MKFSSMVVGAFAALASAAPTKEIEKRSSFVGGNAVGFGFGNDFAFDIFNNGIFNNDPLAYILNFNGIGFNDVNNIFLLAKQQNLAINAFQPLFQLQKGVGLGLEHILLAQTFLTVNWFHKNNLIGGVNFNGIGVPSLLEFGALQGAFNPFIKDFGLQFDNGINDQILAFIAQSQFNVAHTGFGAGGFGFKE